MDFTFGVSETKVFRARALCLASDLFLSLGNTGTGTTRRHTAATTLQPLSEELNNIVDFHRLADLYQSRHPNPHTTLNLARSSALQTRGSWRKLNVAKSGGVTDGRENFACFIWHSGCATNLRCPHQTHLSRSFLRRWWTENLVWPMVSRSLGP